MLHLLENVLFQGELGLLRVVAGELAALMNGGDFFLDVRER